MTPVSAFRVVYRGLVWIANTPRALVAGLVGSVATAGLLYAVSEGKSVGDALWWAVVTASTVGYGDTYPTSTFGRFLAGLLIASMVLLFIPLVTAHFASKLIVDSDAFRHEEQEEIKEHLRAIRQLLEEGRAARVKE